MLELSSSIYLQQVGTNQVSLAAAVPCPPDTVSTNFVAFLWQRSFPRRAYEIVAHKDNLHRYVVTMRTISFHSYVVQPGLRTAPYTCFVLVHI